MKSGFADGSVLSFVKNLNSYSPTCLVCMNVSSPCSLTPPPPPPPPPPHLGQSFVPCPTPQSPNALSTSLTFLLSLCLALGIILKTVDATRYCRLCLYISHLHTFVLTLSLTIQYLCVLLIIFLRIYLLACTSTFLSISCVALCLKILTVLVLKVL